MISSAIVSIAVNVLMVLLLCITIGYCYVLNRRIKILQDSRGELAKILKHFDASTERASDSISALQVASKKISDTIQHRMDKANYLIDDLAYMIEKGEKLANKMEAGFAVSRAQMRAGADTRMEASKVSRESVPMQSAKEKRDAEFFAELTDAAPVVAEKEEIQVKPEKDDFPRYALPEEKPATVQRPAGTQSSSIGAMLERIAKRKTDGDGVGARAKQTQTVVPPKSTTRSQAERELLELIKAGMKG